MPTCEAHGCTRPIKLDQVLCLFCWKLTAPGTQAELMRFYRVGQTKETASEEYLEVKERAIAEANEGIAARKEKQREFWANRKGGAR